MNGCKKNKWRESRVQIIVSTDSLWPFQYMVGRNFFCACSTDVNMRLEVIKFPLSYLTRISQKSSSNPCAKTTYRPTRWLNNHETHRWTTGDKEYASFKQMVFIHLKVSRWNFLICSFNKEVPTLSGTIVIWGRRGSVICKVNIQGFSGFDYRVLDARGSDCS